MRVAVAFSLLHPGLRWQSTSGPCPAPDHRCGITPNPITIPSAHSQLFNKTPRATDRSSSCPSLLAAPLTPTQSFTVDSHRAQDVQLQRLDERGVAARSPSCSRASTVAVAY